MKSHPLLVTIRVTDEERELIKKRAARAGTSLNGYLRQSLGLSSEHCSRGRGNPNWRLPAPESVLCPHGEEPADCDACMQESDFQYDSARERR